MRVHTRTGGSVSLKEPTEFKRQTYCNQVAHYIRMLIRKGVLLPGEPVKEADLAEDLGISRAPIREALQILVHEGLVTSEPQKGKYVRELTAKEILDSYLVGGVLEGAGVAGSLDGWSEEDMDLLAGLVIEMKSLCDKAEGLEELIEIDDLFHDTLLMRCDNARLVEMARLSCSTLSKFLCYRHWLTLFTPDEFFRRHKRVADSVASRDKELVERVLREHYREIGRRMASFGTVDGTANSGI